MSKNRTLAALAVGLVVLAAPMATLGAGHELVVLHTNDLHGRIEIDEGRLGMPYIAALIDHFRAEYEHVLVMDAGDTIHGRPITDQLEGESTAVSMSVAGYDVMVPGNHDFNFGYDRLLELEEAYIEFDLVAVNVFKDEELLFDPYVIKEAGDYTIGIFGLATPDAYVTTHPRNIEGIDFGEGIDPDMDRNEKIDAALDYAVQAAQRYADVLRNEYEVDLVVALGHIGISVSRRIAEEVEGIDLFVDGHSHTRLPEGEWVHDTLIVQAHEYGNYMGKVVIDLSGERPVMEARLISAEEAKEIVEPDETLVELLEEFRAEVIRRLLG